MNIPKRLLLLLCILLGASAMQGQTRNLRGKITDAITGNPVEGATVTLKGTVKNVMSNKAGEFTVEISQAGKSILIVSSVGYVTQEIEATENSIAIALVQDAKTQEEVVVVAYGSQKGLP